MKIWLLSVDKIKFEFKNLYRFNISKRPKGDKTENISFVKNFFSIFFYSNTWKTLILVSGLWTLFSPICIGLKWSMINIVMNNVENGCAEK